MKLTIAINGRERVVTAEEAVTYAVHRATSNVQGELECINARHDALETIVGRMLAEMIENGSLRTNQVETILSYHVNAKD